MKRLCISELVDEVPFTVPCEESRAEFSWRMNKFRAVENFRRVHTWNFRSFFTIADIAMNMQVKFSEPQN